MSIKIKANGINQEYELYEKNQVDKLIQPIKQKTTYANIIELVVSKSSVSNPIWAGFLHGTYIDFMIPINDQSILNLINTDVKNPTKGKYAVKFTGLLGVAYNGEAIYVNPDEAINNTDDNKVYRVVKQEGIKIRLQFESGTIYSMDDQFTKSMTLPKYGAGAIFPYYNSTEAKKGWNLKIYLELIT